MSFRAAQQRIGPFSTFHGSVSKAWSRETIRFPICDHRFLVLGDVGAPFKSKPDSAVYKVNLGNGVNAYLKRYCGLSISRSIKSSLRLRWPRTNAFYEYRMAERLRDKGFEVMEPIAWAECRMAGIVPVLGAVLVKEVPGVPFDAIFRDALYSAARPMMLRHLGELYARLHAAGHVQALRLHDLICRDTEQAQRGCLDLAIIDLDLKGRPATFHGIDGTVFPIALSDVVYMFIRSRHKLLNNYELRMFLRGYTRELNKAGYIMKNGYLSNIIRRVDVSLHKHVHDTHLSTAVPNMPESLSEILIRKP